MGRTQQWVSKRLIFGRFLKFNPTGINSQNLTERRFRELWKRTKGKERSLGLCVPQGHADVRCEGNDAGRGSIPGPLALFVVADTKSG